MFIERRENKIVDEFDGMTVEEIEAWLDEQAEARLKVRHRTRNRGGSLLAASGRCDRRRAQGKPH